MPESKEEGYKNWLEYQTLSLLSATYKTLSHILLPRLTSFIDELLGIISVEFDITNQALVIYSAFIKHYRKLGIGLCVC